MLPVARRRETVEPDARAPPEARAAQEYFPYFEQRSNEAGPRSERIVGRSRRATESMS
jgi:hypothetical protein